VAHVGCGAWGCNLVRELQAHPHVALELLIDPDPSALDRAHALAPQANMARSIDALRSTPVNAVVIASPGPLHTQHALAALHAGADVFLEKPMTTSAADARKLVATCRASERIGMVGHLLHHHGAIRTLIDAVREGRIGVPRSFRSARLCVRGSRDVDGSLLWSLAPHDISVLRALDSSSIRQMHVDFRCLGDPAPNVADVRLHLSSGFEAHIVVSRAHRSKVRRMEVLGELGTILFDDVTSGPKLTLRWDGGVEELAFDRTQPLRTEVDAFVRCVRTRTPPRVGWSEGLEVVEILERAQTIASCGVADAVRIATG
jgi:predicted dehydrogenase